MRKMTGVAMVALGATLLLPRQARPDGEAKTDPTTFGAPGAAGAEYQGATSCKKCHLKEYKSWQKTKMAKSFEVLKAGQVADEKKKAGLDPAKDYTKDHACLPCHTTGYGRPGGYPKAGDEAGAARAAKFEGVQCEVCHGPASLYLAYKKDHEKDFNKEEGKKLGLSKVDPKAATLCLDCHRGGPGLSPTLKAGEKFDAEAKLKEEGAIHELKK
jgi:hypothetical protein